MTLLSPADGIQAEDSRIRIRARTGRGTDTGTGREPRTPSLDSAAEALRARIACVQSGKTGTRLAALAEETSKVLFGLIRSLRSPAS